MKSLFCSYPLLQLLHAGAMHRIFVSLFFLLSIYPSSTAAEWQWSTEIGSHLSGETGSCPRAFLWIPPGCREVRGIVVGMHNMQEEGILEHPHFRKVMQEIGFAEIWITPGLDPLFDPSKGSQLQFDEALDSLARISGYTGINLAPIVPIGHSAYASYPWNFAAWNRERTLAILSVHGDAPLTNLTGCGRPNLDWAGRSTAGIPGLMVMGEYEWWEDRLTPAIAYQKSHPDAPVSLLADAGHGHFDHSDMLVEYLALFIRKASEYRLPETASPDGSFKLKEIDPEKGWLADRWRMEAEAEAEAAPYNLYKGDRTSAFWYFDKEIAHETEKYYAKARGKRAQFIGIRQGKKLLTPGRSHAQYLLNFEPEEDGVTFHLSALLTDSLMENPDLARSGERVAIDRICGPVRKVNDTTFTLSFYRMGLNNQKRTGDIWLLAHHEGDEIYKSAVQQMNMRIPYPLKEGEEQQIYFEPIGDIDAGEKSITLHAGSDSGLPVSFYVREGPAEIEGSLLKITDIPPHARYPVKVTVVAWQYGIKGRYQSAEAVERHFYIKK